MRAVFGTGEDEWRSAPSNLARAVRWIDLGGGLYGPPPGGDDGTGGGPTIDPPGGDGGGGGGDDPVIDGDGDGDGDPDNDDDGVVDIFDRYPNDPKRNEDIPFKFYAVLNPNPDGTFKPAAEDPALGTTIQLNINDSSDFAWGGLEKTTDHGDDGGEIWEYRSAWRQGDSAGQETAVRLYEQQGNGIRYSQLQPIGAGVPNAAGSHGIFAGNVSVVRLVHTVDGWVSPDDKSESGRYTIEQGVIHYDLVLAGYGDWISKQYLGVSQYGKTFGVDRFTTGSNSSRRYHQRASVAGVNIPALASTAITQDVPNLTLKAMSPTGFSVVQRQVAPDPPAMYLCQPDGSASVVPLPLGVVAINDQRQVVGQLDQSFPNADPTRGTLGFLWSPTEGLKVFHDLLPKQNRKQLRSAVPYLISNRDKKLKLYRITFSAECWKTVGTAADWVPGTFVFEKKDKQDPTVQEISLPSVYDATLGQSRPMNVSLTAPGVRGPFAAMVESPGASSTATAQGAGAGDLPSGPQRIPGILPNFEIRSRDIVKGFDPPMAGDVHTHQHESGEPTKDPIDDELDPREWWTSVCQTPTPGAIRDLNLNDHLALVFSGGNEVAKDYELVVKPSVPVPPGDPLQNSSNWITFTNISPLADRNPLVIKGKAYQPDQIGEATLLLRQISTSTTQAVIKVMVLPYKQLRLGVWDVEHPGRPNTIPATHPDGAAILKRIKEAYAQACISFEAISASPQVSVPYDTTPADDILNRDTETITAVGAIDHNLAEVNVAIFQWHDNKHRAYTAQGGPISFFGAAFYLYGETPKKFHAETFLFDVTHEIGHQLGLSTRFGTPANNNANHDLGAFQEILVQGKSVTTYGLMYPFFIEFIPPGSKQMSTLWLRHEDWKAANKTAEDKKVPWQ